MGMPKGFVFKNPRSEAHRRKISERSKGNKYALGGHRNEETRKKISEIRKEWHKKNLGIQKGQKKFGSPGELNYFFNNPYPHSGKDNGMYNKHNVWKNGHPKGMLGKHQSEETKKKIGEGNKGKIYSEESKKLMSDKKKGEKSPTWKGGITPINLLIRNSLEMKKWRKSVLIRDDYTCQKCGTRSAIGKKVYLHAHHILPFAINPENRFDTNNGLTLCKECHIGGSA